MQIFYLHGFNAAPYPDSDIVRGISSIPLVKDFTLLGYDPFDQYENIMKKLLDDIEKSAKDDFVMVGLSLGGFYAAEIAREKDTKCVLINPGRNPFLHLAPAVGWPMRNFVTGKTNTLSLDSHLSYYRKRIDTKKHKKRPLFLLDADDRLISARITKRCYENDSDIVMFPGGNHFFQHTSEALPYIEEYLMKK